MAIANAQPLFILGAPRSGTTFLVHTLNQHLDIHLTSESRIFVLVHDLAHERSARADLLEPRDRPAFLRHLHARGGAFIETFYREQLGIRTRIWGDKHTSYGDPAVLSGRHHGLMDEPVAGSCLDLIDTLLPTAKFIHLHRHPWQVATSLKNRGWVETRSEGLLVWRQHVSEIGRFFDTLPETRRLTLSYAELIESPAEIAAELGEFLHLACTTPIARFLEAQRESPTSFSVPTTDLNAPLAVTTPSERGRETLAAMADITALLGY